MKKLKLGENVLSKTLAGEEVLLDVHTGNYFGMNETGTFLWSKIKIGTTSSELIQALSDDYGLSKDAAKIDVEDFLATLRSDRLIAP